MAQGKPMWDREGDELLPSLDEAEGYLAGRRAAAAAMSRGSDYVAAFRQGFEDERRKASLDQALQDHESALKRHSAKAAEGD